jgi:hypothetical protein
MDEINKCPYKEGVRILVIAWTSYYFAFPKLQKRQFVLNYEIEDIVRLQNKKDGNIINVYRFKGLKGFFTLKPIPDKTFLRMVKVKIKKYMYADS